ncbi:MAG: Ig-like domain-containing protein [Bacilli bacterium]|nr:Ig-like domain-containing protein [Bacilli bacterium]
MKRLVFLLYILLLALLTTLVACANNKIEITGPNIVAVGATITLEAKTTSNEPVVWRSSNKTVATVSKGVVTGIEAGEATIYASSAKSEASIKIKVVGEVHTKEDDPYLGKAKEILSSMSLEQKVGELFILSINGDFSNNIKRVIRNNNIGNVILNPNKDLSFQELVDLVNSIQGEILNNNVVPGFIINTKDAPTYKLLSSLATIPSCITILATNNENNAHDVAYGLGSELRNFGFNATLSPNMLLEDSEYNYLDEPETVSKYALKEAEGYTYAGVMPIGMTFPGTGEDRWDTLPQNGKNMDALKRDDLMPFLNAFENGLDAIIASNVLFTAFDTTYPATLSYPIITTMLKEGFEYDGLIISNYLDDEELNDHYRDKEDNVAVIAIQAGIDMLMYLDVNYINEDYNAIIDAVSTGKIEQARLDEAVIKILLKKYKYDLLNGNNYKPVWNATDYDCSGEVATFNKVAKESISILMGEIPTLDKDKKILVASPLASSDLGVLADIVNGNSFAYIVYTELINKGYNNVDWQVFDLDDWRGTREISDASWEYDYVIFAIGNLDWRRRMSFADNCVFVSLSVPIDISRVNGSICYISAYGYERANVDAFIDCLLNGASINDYRPPLEEDNE